MPISPYYRTIREQIGPMRIFSPSVGAIIRNPQQEVLFVESADDHRWSIPAGAIEIGETPAEAMRREAYEETGLRIQIEGVAAVLGGREFRWTYPDGNEVEYLVVVFHAVPVGGSLEARDGEVARFRWHSALNLPSLALPYPPEIFRSPSSEDPYFQP